MRRIWLARHRALSCPTLRSPRRHAGGRSGCRTQVSSAAPPPGAASRRKNRPRSVVRSALPSPSLETDVMARPAQFAALQPLANGIDATLIVAAGIDIHEIGQQRHHRPMLPAQMFDDCGLRLAGHHRTPISLCACRAIMANRPVETTRVELENEGSGPLGAPQGRPAGGDRRDLCFGT